MNKLYFDGIITESINDFDFFNYYPKSLKSIYEKVKIVDNDIPKIKI